MTIGVARNGFFIMVIIIMIAGAWSARSSAQLVIHPSLAQGEIKITSELDQAIIRVGDLIHWSIVIEAPAGSQVRIIPPGQELGAFFIREYLLPSQLEKQQFRKGRWERLKLRLKALTGDDKPKPGTMREEYRFTLTSYLTGDLVIPTMLITVIDPEQKVHALFTQPAPVRVSAVTGAEDLTIHDIAGPVEIKVPLRTYWHYLASLAGLLVLTAVLILLMLKRRRKPAPEFIPLRPAHELAFEELAALAGEGLLEAGEYERYYTRLSWILRKYLSLRFLIYALEWTTSEILARLPSAPIEMSDFEQVRRFLEESDRVKFARHLPALEERSTVMDRVREIVEHTREVPLAEPGREREAA